MPSLLDMLSGAGQALDLPGSMVRDTLGGHNPFDQLMHPFSHVDRGMSTSGRDLLEQYGVLDKNQQGLDPGDAAGFLTDVVTDPLTWLAGVGMAKRLMRGGKAAAEAANPLKEALEAQSLTHEGVVKRAHFQDMANNIEAHGPSGVPQDTMPFGPGAGPPSQQMEQFYKLNGGAAESKDFDALRKTLLDSGVPPDEVEKRVSRILGEPSQSPLGDMLDAPGRNPNQIPGEPEWGIADSAKAAGVEAGPPKTLRDMIQSKTGVDPFASWDNFQKTVLSLEDAMGKAKASSPWGDVSDEYQALEQLWRQLHMQVEHQSPGESALSAMLRQSGDPMSFLSQELGRAQQMPPGWGRF